MTTRRTFLTLSAGLPTAALLAGPAAAEPLAGPRPAGGGGGSRPRLTNLDHLRFLLEEVPLTAVGTHTTYRIDQEPVALAPSLSA